MSDSVRNSFGPAYRVICRVTEEFDVKVCAVDDVWSGLKLMIRRELR